MLGAQVPCLSSEAGSVGDKLANTGAADRGVRYMSHMSDLSRVRVTYLVLE